MDSSLQRRLAIHAAGFLHTGEKRLLYETVQSERFFRSLSLDDLSLIVGRRIRNAVWNPHQLWEQAERWLRYAESRQIRVVGIEDSSYPPQLREIYDPPYLLFLRGQLPDPETPLAAIVGTRKPGERAREAALSLAHELSIAGVPVVSGLAYGIDAAATTGSLRAGYGGVAVLGTGIDTVYPARHASLAQRILRNGGAIVSEYGPFTPTRRYHFPARNRIIAGLARWTVVVQAPERSGALITADYALEQGRELFVHRAGLIGVVGRGTAALADDGAPVISCAADILNQDDDRPGSAEMERISYQAGERRGGRQELDLREVPLHTYGAAS